MQLRQPGRAAWGPRGALQLALQLALLSVVALTVEGARSWAGRALSQAPDNRSSVVYDAQNATLPLYIRPEEDVLVTGLQRGLDNLGAWTPMGLGDGSVSFNLEQDGRLTLMWLQLTSSSQPTTSEGISLGQLLAPIANVTRGSRLVLREVILNLATCGVLDRIADHFTSPVFSEGGAPKALYIKNVNKLWIHNWVEPGIVARRLVLTCPWTVCLYPFNGDMTVEAQVYSGDDLLAVSVEAQEFPEFSQNSTCQPTFLAKVMQDLEIPRGIWPPGGIILHHNLTISGPNLDGRNAEVDLSLGRNMWTMAREDVYVMLQRLTLNNMHPLGDHHYLSIGAFAFRHMRNNKNPQLLMEDCSFVVPDDEFMYLSYHGSSWGQAEHPQWMSGYGFEDMKMASNSDSTMTLERLLAFGVDANNLVLTRQPGRYPRTFTNSGIYPDLVGSLQSPLPYIMVATTPETLHQALMSPNTMIGINDTKYDSLLRQAGMLPDTPLAVMVMNNITLRKFAWEKVIIPRDTWIVGNLMASSLGTLVNISFSKQVDFFQPKEPARLHIKNLNLVDMGIQRSYEGWKDQDIIHSMAASLWPVDLVPRVISSLVLHRVTLSVSPEEFQLVVICSMKRLLMSKTLISGDVDEIRDVLRELGMAGDASTTAAEMLATYGSSPFYDRACPWLSRLSKDGGSQSYAPEFFGEDYMVIEKYTTRGVDGTSVKLFSSGQTGTREDLVPNFSAGYQPPEPPSPPMDPALEIPSRLPPPPKAPQAPLSPSTPPPTKLTTPEPVLSPISGGSPGKGTVVAGLAGGIGGALLLFVLTGLCILLWYRRRSAGSVNEEELPKVESDPNCKGGKPGLSLCGTRSPHRTPGWSASGASTSVPGTSGNNSGQQGQLAWASADSREPGAPSGAAAGPGMGVGGPMGTSSCGSRVMTTATELLPQHTPGSMQATLGGRGSSSMPKHGGMGSLAAAAGAAAAMEGSSAATTRLQRAGSRMSAAAGMGHGADGRGDMPAESRHEQQGGDPDSLAGAGRRDRRRGSSSGSSKNGANRTPALLQELQNLAYDVSDNIQDNQLVILDVLGSGAFGTVYKGMWQNLPVAVKTLVFNAHRKQSALQEAALSKSICHPNIVATYSFDLKPIHGGQETAGTMTGLKVKDLHSDPEAQDWRLYIIQEFCDGGSLRRALDQQAFVDANSRLPRLDLIVFLAADIARSMVHLHNKHIIHGDLKPENVLLKRQSGWGLQQLPASLSLPILGATDVAALGGSQIGYTCKTADFGLSVMMAKHQSHVSNVKVGTPFYLAPEVTHLGRVTKAADVFAFGVLIWEMYWSKPVWRVASDGRTLKHQHEFPEFPPYCPPELSQLARSCLLHNHVKRPTFEQIFMTLAEVAQRYVVLPSRPPLPGESAIPVAPIPPSRLGASQQQKARSKGASPPATTSPRPAAAAAVAPSGAPDMAAPAAAAIAGAGAPGPVGAAPAGGPTSAVDQSVARRSAAPMERHQPTAAPPPAPPVAPLAAPPAALPAGPVAASPQPPSPHPHLELGSQALNKEKLTGQAAEAVKALHEALQDTAAVVAAVSAVTKASIDALHAGGGERQLHLQRSRRGAAYAVPGDSGDTAQLQTARSTVSPRAMEVVTRDKAGESNSPLPGGRYMRPTSSGNPYGAPTTAFGTSHPLSRRGPSSSGTGHHQ